MVEPQLSLTLRNGTLANVATEAKIDGFRAGGRALAVGPGTHTHTHTHTDICIERRVREREREREGNRHERIQTHTLKCPIHHHTSDV